MTMKDTFWRLEESHKIDSKSLRKEYKEWKRQVMKKLIKLMYLSESNKFRSKNNLVKKGL